MEEKIDDVQLAQEVKTESVVKYTTVQIPRTNKEYKIRQPLMSSQLEALARLLIKKDQKELTEIDEVLGDGKLACKAAAIYVTPGFFTLKLKYWFLWRWFYYIRQYDNSQLQPILSAGVGSTPYIDFLKTMSILSNQKTTQMRMRAKEAEAIMQELAVKATQREEETGNVDTGN